jgi:carboxylesterase type B
MHIRHLLVGALLGNNVLAVSPLVKLNYTTYQGTTLSNGVSQWLGMRYAAPPVGDLRFSAPKEPLHYNDTQPATAHGKTCLATDAGPPSNTTDEDCLFLEVYAPSNATTDSNLPVYFFIQVSKISIRLEPMLTRGREAVSIR